MTIHESLPLTAGNLKNNHIYITPFRDRLPKGVFGGRTRREAASDAVCLVHEGREVKTDVPSTSKGGPRSFFRDRSFIGDFLARTGAEVGDVVLFEEVAPCRLVLSLRKARCIVPAP